MSQKNIPIKNIGSPVDRWNKIMKEVKLERYGSPFHEIPYCSYIQSPIGLVPKAGNKTRSIFHLSYEFDNNGKPEHGSLNRHTPKELCMVKYKDLDHAMRTCIMM